MNADAGSRDALEAWLASEDFGWLDDVTCSALPEGSLGRAEADQILRVDALYQAIRRRFPNMAPSMEVLDAFMNADSDLYSEYYFEPLSASCELGRIGWYGSIEDVIAAAALGKQGSLSAVLVACDLLSHRYDYYGGDSRPLVEGYRYFLPAIASYASGPLVQGFTVIERGPGWWNSDGHWNSPSPPNPLTRALNRALPSEVRKNLVGPVESGDQCSVDSFVAVATPLGLDVSFLSADAQQQAWQSGEIAALLNFLAHPNDDDTDWAEGLLSFLHLALVIGMNLDGLLQEAGGKSASDRDLRSRVSTEHRWIDDWDRESWRYIDCWPESQLRDAVAASPWDWICEGLPEQ